MSSPTNLFSLDGRLAIINGASRGIGRAIAHGLAAAGAHVTWCKSLSPSAGCNTKLRLHYSRYL